MLVSYLLVDCDVCSLEHHNTEQVTQEDQVHVSPGMLYIEESRECLTKVDLLKLWQLIY